MSSQIINEKPEFRPLTLVGGASLTIVLPKQFAQSLDLERGDFLKIRQEGKKLILEKAS